MGGVRWWEFEQGSNRKSVRYDHLLIGNLWRSRAANGNFLKRFNGVGVNPLSPILSPNCCVDEPIALCCVDEP